MMTDNTDDTKVCSDLLVTTISLELLALQGDLWSIGNKPGDLQRAVSGKLRAAWLLIKEARGIVPRATRATG